jgi:outer membrane protein assembly factor BamB
VRFCVFFFIVLAVPLVLSGTASSPSILSATTKICVDPATTTGYFADVFSVGINITDVSNMWSWNFTMYYSKTLLHLQDVEYEWLHPMCWNSYNDSESVEQDYNATHGRLILGMFATSGSGFNGSITIAYVYFNVTTAIGSCSLDIQNSVIKDKSGSQISHDEHDGTFQTGKYTKVVFRFLGVDSGDSGQFRASQELIENLTRFLNWQNTTWGRYNYTSYVHLLSNAYWEAGSLPYYVGLATKANLVSEVQQFLGVTGPGEDNLLTVRIFCFAGDAYHSPPAICLEYLGGDNHASMNDTELDETLTSTPDLANSHCTVAIFDCCYAGAFLNGTHPGRVTLASNQWNETGYAWKGNGPPPGPGYWSFFIGNENAEFGNNTAYGPLGIIGGLFNGDDLFKDGWRSASELCIFAEDTVLGYSTGEEQRTNGGTTVMHARHFFGVACGQVPIVMFNVYKNVLPCPGYLLSANDFSCNGVPLGVGQESPSPWGMQGKSPSRLSYSHSLGPAHLGLLWNRSSLSPIRSSAAISDQSIVIVGADNGSLYAFDLRTGETIWEFDSGAPVGSSPALSDGLVFFGTNSGEVYALDEATGLVRWSFESALPGSSIVSSPAVWNGTVFVGSYGGGGGGGCLYAMDEFGGYQVWNYSTAAGIVSSPAVSDGMVFVGDEEGWLYAFNATDGTREPGWPYPVSYGYPIVSSPAVAEPMVYVTSTNKSVCALNYMLPTPTVMWSFPTNSSITSSPAVDEARNLVIVGSEDGYVYALDRMVGPLPNGSALWKTYVGIIEWSSAAISSNGLIYVGTASGFFYCLNETFGGYVWNCSTSGPIRSSPALTDEHALVSSLDGTLYCFGPEFPYHDVAVLGVTVSPSYVNEGDNVTVEYSIRNLGNRIETFNVTVGHDNASTIWAPPLYLEPVPFDTETLTLQPGQTVNLECEWCTAGKAAGTYRITVVAPVGYDGDTENNAYVSDPVQITTVGAGSGGGGHIPLMK